MDDNKGKLSESTILCISTPNQILFEFPFPSLSFLFHKSNKQCREGGGGRTTAGGGRTSCTSLVPDPLSLSHPDPSPSPTV